MERCKGAHTQRGGEALATKNEKEQQHEKKLVVVLVVVAAGGAMEEERKREGGNETPSVPMIGGADLQARKIVNSLSSFALLWRKCAWPAGGISVPNGKQGNARRKRNTELADDWWCRFAGKEDSKLLELQFVVRFSFVGCCCGTPLATQLANPRRLPTAACTAAEPLAERGCVLYRLERYEEAQVDLDRAWATNTLGTLPQTHISVSRA